MARVVRLICHCNVCNHEWIPLVAKPTHCSRCKSRRWNEGDTVCVCSHAIARNKDGVWEHIDKDSAHCLMAQAAACQTPKAGK